jgi:hypothetical protein
VTVEGSTAGWRKTGDDQQENQPGLTNLDRPVEAAVFWNKGIFMHAGMVKNSAKADVNRALNWHERAMKTAVV